jgi:hypothetical protein
MPHLVLTQAALDAIYEFGDGPVESACQSLPDGRWWVPFAAESLARLDEVRHAGEDDSQVILRLFQQAQINRRSRSADGGHRLAGLRR